MRCFACNKKLNPKSLRWVDTRDGQIVPVGPECFKKINEEGYLPPDVPFLCGPRLYPLTKDNPIPFLDELVDEIGDKAIRELAHKKEELIKKSKCINCLAPFIDSEEKDKWIRLDLNKLFSDKCDGYIYDTFCMLCPECKEIPKIFEMIGEVVKNSNRKGDLFHNHTELMNRRK